VSVVVLCSSAAVRDSHSTSGRSYSVDQSGLECQVGTLFCLLKDDLPCCGVVVISGT
jgi:hypothetical protein